MKGKELSQGIEEKAAQKVEEVYDKVIKSLDESTKTIIGQEFPQEVRDIIIDMVTANPCIGKTNNVELEISLTLLETVCLNVHEEEPICERIVKKTK